MRLWKDGWWGLDCSWCVAVVQSPSHVELFVILWTAARQPPVLNYLLEFVQIHAH